MGRSPGPWITAPNFKQRELNLCNKKTTWALYTYPTQGTLVDGKFVKKKSSQILKVRTSDVIQKKADQRKAEAKVGTPKRAAASITRIGRHPRPQERMPHCGKALSQNCVCWFLNHFTSEVNVENPWLRMKEILHLSHDLTQVSTGPSITLTTYNQQPSPLGFNTISLVAEERLPLWQSNVGMDGLLKCPVCTSKRMIYGNNS